MESELGLGELAGLTVANEADSLAYDVSRTGAEGGGGRGAGGVLTGNISVHLLVSSPKIKVCVSPQIGNNKDAMRKTWNPKFTLRSHFDGIRALTFHPVSPYSHTSGPHAEDVEPAEDRSRQKVSNVEPIYTFRAHRGAAVLSVVMSTSGEQCFSGGVDGTIQCWNTPNPNIDPYDSYDASMLRGELCGHTDSVWGLVYSSAHQQMFILMRRRGRPRCEV
uniref:Striatin-like n=1 Tax=Labrus bergylta TaxID=56723 RepID=A0A3Q3FMJ1_9LABR